MKTPHFWQKKYHPLSVLLTPLSWIYYALHRTNIQGIIPEILPVPVICVGNATAGGAGKTPTVIMLGDMLKTYGYHIHALSRGYGGSLQSCVRVDTQHHSSEEVGDEPLLIAKHIPCWVAKRRKKAADAAIASGANLLIMDDGLQNPSLHKTLTLMVIDGGFGFGNGKVLPAGALREPLPYAIQKSDGFLIIGEDKTQCVSSLPTSKPIFFASITPEADAYTYFKNKKVFAFAGIARPQKFYDTLEQLGAQIVGTKDFSDHQFFSLADLQNLQHEAARFGAELVTTEKDMVRIPASFHPIVTALPIRLQCDKQDDLLAWIISTLKEHQA
jgi:tetraacyldisaccharide 4'-kinase